MLRRSLLAATWLAGTLLATVIVYEAVGVVAGQVTDQRPEPISQSAVSQSLSHPAVTIPSSSPAQTAAPTASPTTPATPTAAPATGGAGTQPPPTAAAAPTTRTFALVGGTASLSCGSGAISLDWATPNPGFQVETGTSDGGAQVEVRFRSDSHESRLDAWCAGGQVQGAVEEESS
jgi:cytoskeletal protein RodZ